MLRWMRVVTKKDKVKKEHVNRMVKVASEAREITEIRVTVYGGIYGEEGRREEGCQMHQ